MNRLKQTQQMRSHTLKELGEAQIERLADLFKRPYADFLVPVFQL